MDEGLCYSNSGKSLLYRLCYDSPSLRPTTYRYICCNPLSMLTGRTFFSFEAVSGRSITRSNDKWKATRFSQFIQAHNEVKIHLVLACLLTVEIAQLEIFERAHSFFPKNRPNAPVSAPVITDTIAACSGIGAGSVINHSTTR